MKTHPWHNRYFGALMVTAQLACRGLNMNASLCAVNTFNGFNHAHWDIIFGLSHLKNQRRYLLYLLVGASFVTIHRFDTDRGPRSTGPYKTGINQIIRTSAGRVAWTLGTAWWCHRWAARNQRAPPSPRVFQAARKTPPVKWRRNKGKICYTVSETHRLNFAGLWCTSMFKILCMIFTEWFL